MGVREPMTGTSSSASSTRFVIVTLGGRYLALDAEAIQGVLTLEEVGYDENPTSHGMVYRAINLADRLSLSIDQGGVNARIVLLSEREARGSIRVNSVQGVLETHQSQLLPLPAHFCGSERDWYRGMILFDRSIAMVLSTAWIFDAHTAGSDTRDEVRATRSCESNREITIGNDQAC